jgi:hypothetical protein
MTKRLCSPILAITLWLLCIAIGACFKDETVNATIGSLDDAVKALESGSKSFEELTNGLNDFKGKLDQGQYRDQVQELINTAGLAGQKLGMASFDFFRDRVVHDLRNIVRQIKGEPALEPAPFLSTAQSEAIDYRGASRSKLTIAGWNLHIAKKNPAKYRVVVKNREGPDRVLTEERAEVSYQGQYSLTLDTSSSGIRLRYYDSKVVFEGYDQPFEIAIINSDPPPPPPQKVLDFTLTDIIVNFDCDSGRNGGDFEGRVMLRRPDGTEVQLANLDVIDGEGHDTRANVREGERARVDKVERVVLIEGQSFRVFAIGMLESTGDDHEFDDNSQRNRLDEVFSFEEVKTGSGQKVCDDTGDCKVTFVWSIVVR